MVVCGVVGDDDGIRGSWAVEQQETGGKTGEDCWVFAGLSSSALVGASAEESGTISEAGLGFMRRWLRRNSPL